MTAGAPSRRLLPLLVLAGGAFAGCTFRRHPQALVPPSIDKNLQPTLQISPLPVRQMDPSTFTARIVDAHGKPVSDASVILSLTMPAMDMGRIQVITQPRGDGRYVGTGRFTMAGGWNVSATVRRGSEMSVRTFSMSVR